MKYRLVEHHGQINLITKWPRSSWRSTAKEVHETRALTLAMRDSGTVLEFPEDDRPPGVDKIYRRRGRQGVAGAGTVVGVSGAGRVPMISVWELLAAHR